MQQLLRSSKYGLKAPLIFALILALSSLLAFLTPAEAATGSAPVNLIFYGVHNDTIDQRIINARPEFMVDNSPAGPWKGNANISKFKAAGIKYFEYLDGGYEGTVSRSIPNDLTSNLNYITSVDLAGAYGIFLDEVSDGNFLPANYTYLQQIASKAHGLGLKVVFNTGMSNWADRLMSYCDYMNSSEYWVNSTLTASQSKWASRTWLESNGISDENTAVSLTLSARSLGIRAHYACLNYTQLSSWMESYTSKINLTPDFSLGVNPGLVSFNRGSKGTFTVSVSPQGGFSRTVVLRASSNSSRLTVSPTSTTVIAPYAPRSFSLRSFTSGSYRITVTGYYGSLTHSATVNVTVK